MSFDCLIRVVFLILGTSVTWHKVDAQAPQASEEPLIEATTTMQGVGHYKHQSLWIRIGTNGQVECEQAERNGTNSLHHARAEAREMEHLRETLHSADWSRLKGDLGIYNVYIDSSVEIQVTADGGKHKFSVVNALVPGTRKRQFGGDVKKILCELDILRSEATGESIAPNCRPSTDDGRVVQ